LNQVPPKYKKRSIMTSAKLLIRGKPDKNQEKLSVRIANF